jgi:hypothetical protein
MSAVGHSVADTWLATGRHRWWLALAGVGLAGVVALPLVLLSGGSHANPVRGARADDASSNPLASQTPLPGNVPPQLNVSGPPMATSTILQQIVGDASGVTDSAIKTVPYGTIAAALAALPNASPSWNAADPSSTPVAESADVDVVVIAGTNLSGPFLDGQPSTASPTWAIDIVDPVNGVPIQTVAAPPSYGSWPSFWPSLPDDS